MMRTAGLVAGAILIIAVGLWLVRPKPHYPFARVEGPDGIALEFRLALPEGAGECSQRVEQVTAPLLAQCPGCRLVRSSCGDALPPEPDPVAARVIADRLRILIEAPVPAVAVSLCQAVALDLARTDPTAHCQGP